MNAVSTSIHQSLTLARNMNSEPVSLEVGQIAPDFVAELTNGDEIILSEILSSGEKVIIFILKIVLPVVLFRHVISEITFLDFSLQVLGL